MELIGRIAHFKYSASVSAEFESMPLETKIEFVVDDVLKTQGILRIEPVIITHD